MANSEGAFGGNGSVNWRVHVRNPIRLVSRKKPRPKKGWVQLGHEATPRQGRFTITIKLPKSSGDRFFPQFGGALANAKRRKMQFTLPIEPKNRNQITIAWPSSRGGRGGARKKR